MRVHHVNTTPKYPGASYGANRLLVNGISGTGFGVNEVLPGDSARKVDGGDLVPGPWAYAFGLCIIIDNNGGTGRSIREEKARGVLVEADMGDVLEINGRHYQIKPLMQFGRESREHIDLIPVELVAIPANPGVGAVDPSKWPAVDATFIAPPTTEDAAADVVYAEDRIPGLIEAGNKIIDAYWTRMGFTHDSPPRLSMDPPRKNTKYARIVRRDGNGSSASVHCFVDLNTGNVLKAASYMAPVLANPRSNVFDKDYGASGLTEHGVRYLR